MTDIISLDHVLEVSNYRTEYDANYIQGLADSMIASGFKPEFAITVYAVELGNLKTHAVETFYVINTGHCRTRAARLAKLSSIPAIVKDGSNPIALKLDQLGENENRRDPNDIDRANGYKSALDAGATIDQLSKATGRTKDYIERRIKLLALIPEIQHLVKSEQFSIMYAMEIHRLDRNFQLIAMRYYQQMKSPTLDEFKTIVNDLYTKQSQSSLFDLALFSGKPIEMVLDELKIEHKKTRAELEAELEAERKARKADREYAIKKYSQAQQEIARLRAQLAAEQKAA